MSMEESGPNSEDHILDWLDGSISFIPTVVGLEEIYNPGEMESDEWWGLHNQEIFDHCCDDGFYTSTTTPSSSSNPVVPNSPQQLSADHSSKKKRKPYNPDAAKRSTNNHHPTRKQSTGGGGSMKRQNANSSSSNNNNKEGRWAEQLLNPCAAAITAGNMSRVQHLLYVLHELSSPSGDSNHRLASYGLKALTLHLSEGGVPPPSRHHHLSTTTTAFATTKPQAFQKSLMRFDEVSPYFMFPNKLANSSILHLLSSSQQQQQQEAASSARRNPKTPPPSVLHILDIGVSHGIQWPTLFEALTSRPGGPPPLVRLTVVGSASLHDDGPFSSGPPGHTNSPQLVGFAKSLNLNLQINRLDDITQLHGLTKSEDEDEETLIVCAQFRLHQLSHQNPDQRSDILKVIRGMNPKGVILSENNCECSCLSCSGDYATGFKRRVEFLWRFLDSTSVAFKGRESEERRVMEGEAAKALTSMCELNEGRDKWCDRMRRCGFVAKGFGEDALDEARALLRKYDGGWEMRTTTTDHDHDHDHEKKEARECSGCVGLWYKSQPVSFCSLWGICPIS